MAMCSRVAILKCFIKSRHVLIFPIRTLQNLNFLKISSFHTLKNITGQHNGYPKPPKYNLFYPEGKRRLFTTKTSDNDDNNAKVGLHKLVDMINAIDPEQIPTYEQINNIFKSNNKQEIPTQFFVLWSNGCEIPEPLRKLRKPIFYRVYMR